jgi:Na+-transporting NADH:ubiquinone oxidoreductase subunit F
MLRTVSAQITINNQRSITAPAGKSLFEALQAQSIPIPSACGGQGVCGLCKVKVLTQPTPTTKAEEKLLGAEEIKNNIRLSCQLALQDNTTISIEIAPELVGAKQYTCRCAQINDLTQDVRQLQLELTEPDYMHYVPGQHIQLLTPPYEKCSERVRRAYSMAGDPADTHLLELIVRRTPGGICSTYLFEYLHRGDTITISGPYGEFRLSNTDADIVFVAGGSGIAPIKCMLHQMKNENIKRKAVLYFGANTIQQLLLAEKMRAFEKELFDFTFVPVVAQPGDNWTGETGLVTEALGRRIKNAADCEAYLCGGPGMIEAAVRVLAGLGMPKDKIYYDKFV